VLTVISFGLYFFSRDIVSGTHGLMSWFLFDEVVAVANMGIILSAITNRFLSDVLCTRPLQYLGKLSFSLYLAHEVVFLTILQLFARRLPLGIFLAVLILAIIVFTWLFYQLIEKPSHALSRKIPLQLKIRFGITTQES
jgi:peptidoglycan/LPS O-acetylase OafA/YrhL